MWQVTNTSRFFPAAAFFTLGPILVTKDVPKGYQDKYAAEADTWLKNQADGQAPSPDACLVQLPIAGGKG
jgi:hypothetical protein